MKIGFTSGVFDLFHIGHLNIIKKAKKNCDFLIVAVTNDNLAFKLKNKKSKIDFLKIDAEAEDLKILEGASNLLRKKRVKLIKIELLNSLNKDNNKSNVNQIIFLLNKYG